MSLLVHAAAFIGELAMVNARTIDEFDLVENCLDINKLEASPHAGRHCGRGRGEPPDVCGL